MRKTIACIVSGIGLAASVFLAGCGSGGGDDGGGDGGGDVDPLVGTWAWVNSVWTGSNPRANTTYSPAILAGFGASLSIVAAVAADGTLTVAVDAVNVSGGDIHDTRTGTWSATSNRITMTTEGGSVTVPYTLSDDNLTLTITTLQMLTLAEQSLPLAYMYLGDATAVATFERQ